MKYLCKIWTSLPFQFGYFGSWSLFLQCQLINSDTNRLREVANSVNILDEYHFKGPLLLMTLSVLQLVPLITLLILILTKSEQTSQQAENNQQTTTKAKFSTKLMLCYFSISSLIFWLEPSFLSLLLDYFLNHPTESKSCILPPWFWIDQPSAFVKKVVPVHGWASYMDLLNLNGIIGLGLLFLYMKREYIRHCEVDLLIGNCLGHRIRSPKHV